MMDAMPAEELAEELVGVIHRTMDSERRERRKRELERDFDTNDEALLERCVQHCCGMYRTLHNKKTASYFEPYRTVVDTVYRYHRMGPLGRSSKLDDSSLLDPKRVSIRKKLEGILTYVSALLTLFLLCEGDRSSFNYGPTDVLCVIIQHRPSHDAIHGGVQSLMVGVSPTRFAKLGAALCFAQGYDMII